MSASGAPQQTLLDASALRVAIVAAKWHQQVMDGLIAGAERALADAGVRPENVDIIRVPGTFELPVAAARLTRSIGTKPLIKGIPRVEYSTGPKYDAIVAFGVVVRGGTPHFEYVCDAATTGLTQVSVETGIPIGFGVLTCDNDAQALDRAGLPGSREDKGYEATMAALETALTLADY